jgi:hypothetical protein
MGSLRLADRMTRAPKIASCLLAATLACLALGACGSTARPTAGPAGFTESQLRAFQLMEVGAPHASDGRSWQQYGSRPVGAMLTINPMTLYDAGPTPLVLLGIRQATPVRGLSFRAQLVTLTPGFAAYSEFVSAGPPADAFGAHANFSPLRGFELSPDPRAQMSTGLGPTVVLTATAHRSGVFHIGDWLVSYRVNSVRHTLKLVDDGTFCAGTKGCPAL